VNGGLYQYFGVPDSAYSELMAAPSHGAYFDAYIKDGGYQYLKLA
jgi:hypothetical protein